MAYREPFEIGEWYHCYNRGVDKRKVFENEFDANRFLMLLYLANGKVPVRLYNSRKPELETAFDVDRGKILVSIGAYCLMPNHFHLLIKEITEGGITLFMQRLGTAYAMYFNAKNDRVGNLFLKPFRACHVAKDSYFQKVLEYVHCNPADLYESEWKQGKVRNMRLLEKRLIEYPYSSLRAYVGNPRAFPILSADGFEVAVQYPLPHMLEESRAYYEEVARATLER